MTSFLAEQRVAFHRALLATCLTVDEKRVCSNADKDNRLSIKLALAIAERLPDELRTIKKETGQRSGKQFETAVRDFLSVTFAELAHLRPADWVVSRSENSIAAYEQYAHLTFLDELTKKNPALKTALQGDYLILPDVVVCRAPLPDDRINRADLQIVDSKVARLTGLRSVNNDHPLLHASISCKWTLRSDRAQNARTEALNLVRNRKGRLPHIVVVTGEPLPSRLASIALGTGDIDTVYHFALPELVDAVKDLDLPDALDSINIMIDGKRIRDIADLPLDLAS
jgi:hypothetical protein